MKQVPRHVKTNLLRRNRFRISELIKNHKPGLLIRPVVASYCHPAFALSKFLATFFVASSNFVSSHSIKNSTELAAVLSVLEFPPSTSLNSFHVTNMYSNIPVCFTIKLMCDLMISSDPTVLEFRKLINICVRYNFCGFRNRIYIFKDGLPMGGPLSASMANVFMDYLEVDVLRTAPDAQHVLGWYRFVDDILCVWSGS